MRDLKNVYRRYAVAFATFSLAISIGFVMQSTEASVLSVQEEVGPIQPSKMARLPEAFRARISAGDVVLPRMPQDHSGSIEFPEEPVLVAVANDHPVGLLPAEETTPRLQCEISATATVQAGAMVGLDIFAPCHSDELITLEHAGLVFLAEIPNDGRLKLSVTALAETAEFVVHFLNGDRIETTAVVESLVFYDRIAIQWQGNLGPELHAREYGANYGEAGHVWLGAPRDVSALVGGAGGFLTSFGSQVVDEGARAQVYTFPSGTAVQSGDIKMSIEAEVTQANCARPMEMFSAEVRAGKPMISHALTIEMPDCSAIGEFLVLKNLVEDLTIAEN